MARPRAIRRMSERPSYLSILVYGHPGSGKTPLAGTSERALILNADGADAIESARVEGSNSHTWDITDFKDLDRAYEYLRHDAHPYRWVWLDGITLCQELGMDQVMNELVERNPRRNLFVPDQPQYLETQNHLSKWVRNMKKLQKESGINFGMTAHVMSVEDPQSGEVVHMPAIQGGRGALASKMCGHFAIVGRLHVVTKRKEGDEKVFHVLQTEAKEGWYARDRFDATTPRLVSPTIPKIEALIAARGPKKTTMRRKSRES